MRTHLPTWWAIALRGVCALLFALFAFLLPIITLEVLILLFAAYMLVDGVVALALAFQAARRKRLRNILLADGLVSCALGLIGLFWPHMAALALVWFIAFWAVLSGVLEILAGMEFRGVLPGGWFFLLAGVASVVCGLLLFAFPAAGALVIIWMIATYTLFFGILLLALAFSMIDFPVHGPHRSNREQPTTSG